jgi:ankyrin repeat protein
MSPRTRYWLIAPWTLVLASIALAFALEAWRDYQRDAEMAAQRHAQQATAQPAPKRPARALSVEDLEAQHAAGTQIDFTVQLHRASDSGNLKLLDWALSKGADVNATDKYGATALSKASRAEMIEALLARGAKPDLGRHPSPLAEASRRGDVRAVALLLEKGADPNRANAFGITPLSSAVFRKQPDIVHLLLAGGAKVAAAGSGVLPSLLHVAAYENQVEIARQLIAAGADVRVKAPSGWTALHVASSLCHEEFARVLVAAGADPNARDLRGNPPLPCYAFARKPTGEPMRFGSCR